MRIIANTGLMPTSRQRLCRGRKSASTTPRADELLNIRGKLLFEPSAVDGLSVLVTYAHNEAGRPQTEDVGIPFEDLIRDNQATSYFEVESDSVVAKATLTLNDNFSLRNTTTYADVLAERKAPPGTGDAALRLEEISNEFIINYVSDDEASDGLFGIYYLSSDGDDFLDLTDFGLGGGDFVDESDSFGVFGEFNLALTDRLIVTAGGRYQRDRQVRSGGFGPIGVDFDFEFDAFLPKFGLAYDVSEDLRLGAIVQRGYNPGGETFSFTSFETETFSEEFLWNYEAYARGTFLDGRLTANANVYYTDFENAQRVAQEDLGGGFTFFSFFNAEDARAIGLNLIWPTPHQTS